MRFSLLALTLAALTLAACGKPNQALPEQEKARFETISKVPVDTSPEIVPPPISADEDLSGPTILPSARADGSTDLSTIHKPVAPPK